MLNTNFKVLREIAAFKPYQIYLSTAQPLVQERLQIFRTSENDPRNHTSDHIAQFYTLNNVDKQQLFSHGGLTTKFLTQAKTFNETCLMVRKPALDLINCLKHIDYNKPPVKFVMYGQMGAGKSLSLAHVLHYAFKEGYLIAHVPWVGEWMRRCKEVSNSESKEGYFNLNLEAAAWLLHFKTQNSHILAKPEMVTNEDHVWSKREATPKGSPLIKLIEHGMNRIKYACDSVIALSHEIKQLSNDGICKTLVAIDGFNAFFYPHTRVFAPGKQVIPPNKVTLAEAFLNLTKFDWKNSAIITTVDEIAIAEKDQISHLPRYLLQKEGFEHMDPFVPIFVENYTSKELTSIMDYYRERKWVSPYKGLDEEVSFLSNNNPYKLMEICAKL